MARPEAKMMARCLFCGDESRVVKAPVFRFGVTVETDLCDCPSCGGRLLTLEQEEEAERLALAALDVRERVPVQAPARRGAARARAK
jgi:DNA-directed RNA polymerase subunit RPC12/RpoP